ncbi:MAG: serine hydrolase [Bacteroidota bacterium]
MDALSKFSYYNPLGLRYSTFNPSKYYNKERLVPTQWDKRWRHQLVHGHVHDETAALMGGVAGHAGLFSTAEDLAVIFQMLLDGGTYGDRVYLSPETIKKFTGKQRGSSRGIGFDKPNRSNESAVAKSASPATFGHTGFTGTCVWADPDEDLIFIFLSNRIHPYIKNPLMYRQETRRRIHQVVYDALGTYQTDKEIQNHPLIPYEMKKAEDNLIKGD